MNKRKDGRWQEKVRAASGKYIYFYGNTKADVKRKMSEYAEAEVVGKRFCDVADEWWEEHEPTLSYTTTKPYVAALKRAKLEYPGYILEISPQQVAAFIEDFSGGRARKTVATQLMVLRLIFRFAIRKGYIRDNPARDIELPKNLPSEKRTPPKPEEIAAVRNNQDEEFALFAMLAMYAGLRKGEILALDWEDIDIKERTISITKSWYSENNKAKVKAPKTETSFATVPILDALLPILEKRKKAKGHLFAFEPTGDRLTEMQFRTRWKNYCRHIGITATPHQFRHAYATMLFEANVPPEKMQILLRHAQLSTTMDIYRDIREEKVRSIHSEVLHVDYA